MLIRAEQKQELGKARLGVFVEDMMVHLAARSEKAAAMPEAELRAFVHAGIDEARPRGITKRFDLRRYLEHRIGHGDGFASLSWVAPVLDDASLDGSAKMDRLDGKATFEVRGEA